MSKASVLSKIIPKNLYSSIMRISMHSSCNFGSLCNLCLLQKWIHFVFAYENLSVFYSLFFDFVYALFQFPFNSANIFQTIAHFSIIYIK